MSDLMKHMREFPVMQFGSSTPSGYREVIPVRVVHAVPRPHDWEPCDYAIGLTVEALDRTQSYPLLAGDAAFSLIDAAGVRKTEDLKGTNMYAITRRDDDGRRLMRLTFHLSPEDRSAVQAYLEENSRSYMDYAEALEEDGAMDAALLVFGVAERFASRLMALSAQNEPDRKL